MNLGPVPKFVDGYYDDPVRISRTPRRYPFDGNLTSAGVTDDITAEYDATYLVDEGAYVKTARGTLDPEARSVAISSANTGTAVITCAAAHGFVTGQCLHLTVTTGLTGLSTGKAYFAIVTSSTTLKLALNSEYADAGTAVSISADGTGTLQEGFYLLDETKPEIFEGDISSFRRTYGNIPRQQITFDRQWVKKPDLPGEFPQVSGDALIIQPEPNVPRWIFYTQKVVTSDTGAPNGSSPTGGTYTVTIGGSTTSAIAYNASAATLQTALNALTSVSTYGSVTVTGSYTTGFIITFNSFTPGTLDTTNMLPIPGVGAPQAVLKGVQVFDLRRMLFKMAAPNGYAFDNSATFTITVFGQTTAAIPVTSTLASVKTAIEALSNVGSGGVSSMTAGTSHGHAFGSNIMDSFGDLIEFTVNFAESLQTVSVTGTSLTPVGSTATITPLTAGLTYRLTFLGIALATRVLYSAAHGITALDGIVVTQGTTYRTIAAGLYSVSTDTITLTAASGAAFSNTTLITIVGKANGNIYTADSKLTRTKEITDYYLPGKSVGITTPTDIPLPIYEGDDASLLTAIFDGDTEINLEIGSMGPYRDGPIHSTTRTTINAAQL